MKFYGNYGENKHGAMDGTVPIYRGRPITDSPVAKKRSRWEQFLGEYPNGKPKLRGFNGKKVRCIATGKIYPSIQSAAEDAHISNSGMRYRCRDRRGWVKVDE